MPDINLNKENIFSEVHKLQYLYGLKREIRYGQNRPENDLTESVAEHIYGMHLLAHYFLPLEDPKDEWDKLKIFSMITVHDLDEIETGDTISYLKTPEMYANEMFEVRKVIEKSPLQLKSAIDKLLTEYNERMTIESRFVKAIDAFEPLIQIYTRFGWDILKINKTTAEQSASSKEIPIKPFPVMYKYYRTIQSAMIDEGYFKH